MKILHLTLTKKWFDLIASGEKPEEYREIKDYWAKRLVDEMYAVTFKTSCSFFIEGIGEFEMDSPIHYDCVKFRNGYQRDAPSMKFEIESIGVGTGKFEWGADHGKQYFVIKLGKKL
jgi:hypothetical protein